MIYAILPPDWLRDADPNVRPQQLECSFETALQWNEAGFNVYYYPNYPSMAPTGWLQAHEIDVFEWVFLDLDMKHGAYASKEEFLDVLGSFALQPSKIVDSGGGIHAYWRVSDLNAMGFLKLSRRLMRHFKTDDAVQQLKQLMRVPGTRNMKYPDEVVSCELLYETDLVYTSEQLDKELPSLLHEDATYCKTHYDRAHNKEDKSSINDKLPIKFGQLLNSSQEVKDIWTGITDDRSKSDYRLGHIMLAAGFSRSEALSVLVNSAKALDRAPVHRVAYAEGIVDKIFTFEIAKETDSISSTVKDILSRQTGDIKGTRFPCWKWLDNTNHGFRLGQVMGIVGGVGIGKTAITLDMFMGFVQLNMDCHHVFVSLEQPKNEIAERWRDRCGDKHHLHDKVHIISNYDDEGGYRNLSLSEIKDHILELQKTKNIKIGCVVIDHIGVLKKKGAKGENQDLMDICHTMKGFAVETNTFLIMQSQAPRQKAGIGDLELDKDAAYGTVFFEAYCDYMVTLWQPLKRCYSNEDCPTVTAFKFCKIRHKKRGKDTIQEDIPYWMFFDPNSGELKELTQKQEGKAVFFNSQAAKSRSRDKKVDVLEYTSVRLGENGKANTDQDAIRTESA